MPIQANTPVFTAKEAAEFIGLSLESIRKYVQKGRIKPAQVIGRSYLFTQAECERFKPTIRPVGNPNFVRKSRPKRSRKNKS